MKAAIGSVQFAPNRNLNILSLIWWRPIGASNHAVHIAPWLILMQGRLKEVRIVDRTQKALRDHLQSLIVSGSGRHGGRSASSSFKSTQNQTEATIRIGARVRVKNPMGLWSINRSMLMPSRLATFQYMESSLTMAVCFCKVAQTINTSGRPTANVAANRYVSHTRVRNGISCTSEFQKASLSNPLRCFSALLRSNNWVICFQSGLTFLEMQSISRN